MVCLVLSGTGGSTQLGCDVTVTLSATDGKASTYVCMYVNYKYEHQYYVRVILSLKLLMENLSTLMYVSTLQLLEMTLHWKIHLLWSFHPLLHFLLQLNV